MKPIRISGRPLNPETLAEWVGMSKREYKQLVEAVDRSLREGVYEYPRQPSPRKVNGTGAPSRRGKRLRIAKPAR